ncbi:hypothetical protein [Ruegeria sp. HKCCD4332]|uniref:hypothetical protein n=1 Tax=Ruegeria sp. HKCCD4332 TaxID=2683021 RepID=UPI001492CA97|nr:hypothetical protein [Ruegeria sp. HKCCD4332]NOD75942.1 hypothetical protein [Ruegeria sp. HKCCD4332]
MGRGGYLGGSTIIYPGNRGWSYDPLETVGQPRNKAKKNTKTIKRSAKKIAGNDFLHDFALSCACCKIYDVPWPKLDPSEPRLKPLLDKSGHQFHKQFRNKVTHSQKAARRTLNGYIAQCASSDVLGRSRPGLPKSIRYVTSSEEFIDIVESEIEVASQRTLDKAISAYADTCATKERQGLKRPPEPDRLKRLFNGEIPSDILETKIEEAKNSKTWKLELRSNKQLSKPDKRS